MILFSFIGCGANYKWIEKTPYPSRLEVSSDYEGLTKEDIKEVQDLMDFNNRFGQDSDLILLWARLYRNDPQGATRTLLNLRMRHEQQKRLAAASLVAQSVNQGISSLGTYQSYPPYQIQPIQVPIVQPTTKINTTYFPNQGIVAQKIGNTVFFNDSTTATRIGNTTFFNTGLSAQTIGSTTFYSDGLTANRIGNTTFFSNNAIATKFGNTIFVNNGISLQHLGTVVDSDS